MIKSKQSDAQARAKAQASHRHLACAFIVSFSLFALLIASSLCSSLAQLAAPPATAARNAALVAATDEVLKETSELRQLSIMKPVASSAQSRNEIQRAIIKNLDEGASPAELHASEVALKKLGLAPPNFNYRDLMVRLLTEQIAGYYEPKTQQFHLADWIDVDGQRPVMAHELTHALQDQHFNLRRFEKFPRGESDAELAAHSLIEGDATLLMVLYVTNNPLRALTFLKSLGSMAGASEEINKAPRAVRESLLFPYQEGLNWTRDLYRRGGWNEVSRAFTTLPQSTEQILHPEKYFSHEAPVKITLPNLAALLNSPRPEIRGERVRNDERRISNQGSNQVGLQPLIWKRISSDVNGEFGFYLILDQFLKSPVESRRAAAGWSGDRFDIYENARGEALYVSSSVWDTEIDAREFFDAYVKRAGIEYPAAQRMNMPGSVRFETADGEALITLFGSRVFVIETPRSVPALSLLCAVNSEAPNCRSSMAVIFSR